MAIAVGADTIGSILGQLQSINLGDIASQMAIGAIATAGLAGVTSQAGQNALDPLHLVHKDGSQTAVGGKTISAAVFNGMDATGRAQILAAGYSIIG